MTQKIAHTKRHAAWSAAACFLWMSAVTSLLDGEALGACSLLQRFEGVLNLSLLLVLLLFIRCLILLFRERLLLQGGERGLFLQVSGKNRGVIPWRHIAGFACSPDHRSILIYLQGMWDIPDGCGEHFDIRTDHSGKRMIFLPLRRKVHRIDRVRETLEEWLLYFSQSGKTPPPAMDESAQRRKAAAKKHSLATLLVPLYFLRSKYWLLILISYLLIAGSMESATALSRPAVLVISLALALPVGVLSRYLLAKGISALERHKAESEQRMVGL